MSGGPARLVLVGFMAAGKTTVGRLLAERLRWDFVDLDERIRERSGRSVPELFAELGEAAFRDEERRAARELLARERCVAAAGGGAFAQPETRALLSQGALTIWLRAGLETLLARLPQDGARPLAANRARIPALLAERESSYRLADLSVDTDSASPQDVVETIVRLVRARAAGSQERQHG